MTEKAWLKIDTGERFPPSEEPVYEWEQKTIEESYEELTVGPVVQYSLTLEHDAFAACCRHDYSTTSVDSWPRGVQ